MDDISQKYVGEGSLFLIANAWPTNPVNTITINHVTGFPDPQGGLLMLGNLHVESPDVRTRLHQQHRQRWPVRCVEHRLWHTSCAHTGVPLTSLNNCFASYTFNNNALVSVSSQFPPSSWPTGNFFPSDPDAVDFVNYNGGNGGDYTLQSTSPYKNMGTDGKDLGADIAGLNQALAGVE